MYIFVYEYGDICIYTNIVMYIRFSCWVQGPGNRALSPKCSSCELDRKRRGNESRRESERERERERER